MASWDFTLANYGPVWSFMVQVGMLMIFLMLGNLLRNIVPFFRKSQIPSALIGGAMLLCTNIICKSFDFVLLDKQMMQVITYHGLGLGFAAMTLKTEEVKMKTKGVQIFEFAALQGGTYMLQAFLGLFISILLFFLTRYGDTIVSYICGLLLPLAFGQGPGNALSWDINFTNTPATMFAGNGSFGLSLASIGFIVASVFGVIYINIYKKRGTLSVRKSDTQRSFVDPTNPDGNEIPDSESVDKFTIQVGLVAIVYAIAFAIMCGLAVLSDFTNSIAWGFNFLWAAIGATLVKVIVKQLRRKKIMKRVYINNYQMDRISGFAFDLMIVAGVAAIEINDIRNYILPIIILSIIGTAATYAYIRQAAKACFKGFEHEFFLLSFGTLTGTASNGMIMMKEIDPDLRSPTATLYVQSNFPAMVFIAPLLFLLNFAAGSLSNALIACAIFFVLWLGYSTFIFRRSIFRKKYENEEPIVWSE